MSKGSIAPVAFSVASTTIALWALYRWYKIRNSYYSREKEEELLCTQKYLMNEYGNLSRFTLLKDLVNNDCSHYMQEFSSYCNQICEKCKITKNKLLLIKSKTGKLAFSLASDFKEIIGLEDSYQMIVASQQLAENNECVSFFPSEGLLHSICKYSTPKIKNKHITFIEEGTLEILKGNIKFDCVITPNCLKEMEDPIGFLKQIANFVRVGGLLIIADTYDWENVNITNTDHQMTIKRGRTIGLMSDILKNSWKFVEERNLPYCFIHSERRMEVGNLHVTVWQRNIFETYFIPVNKL